MELYLCCQEMYMEGGDSAESSACPTQDVVKRWLDRHSSTAKRKFSHGKGR